MADIPSARRSHLRQFFFLTFALSWLAWSLTATAGRRASLLFFALGGFCPSLVGVGMTYLDRTARSAQDFWQRVIDIRLIRPCWYSVIFLLSPCLMAAALLVDVATGGRPPGLDAALRTASQPRTAISFLMLMVLGGPLSEELGWRGYALDLLQTRWSALSSAMVLGSLWALWHLPLFFIKGTSQNAMGIRAAPLVLFSVHIIALSVLITWVYNNNGRSTLSAIMMHFMSNTTLTIAYHLGGALPLRTNLILTVMHVLGAMTVAFAYGPALITRTVQTPPTHV